MSTHYNQSFKDTMVEKALNRNPGVTIESIVKEHNISRSALGRWIKEAQQAEPSTAKLTEEKRPRDWARAERLQAIIDCGALDEEATSAYCRQQGIYPHHLEQWKKDFLSAGSSAVSAQSQLKQLKSDNKLLQQELRRKEKALAEAAALLVLKKKAQRLLGNDEDN